MIGRWTQHAYRLAHDGSTNILHLAEGIRVVQGKRSFNLPMNLVAHSARDFLYHPGNRHVVFWAPPEPGKPRNCVAFMSLADLVDGKPTYQLIYVPAEGRTPFGLEWSPDGECLFVIERARENRLMHTVIQRIDLKGEKKGEPQEIVRRLGVIDFFMPPVSRFEGGQGPNKAPYRIIYGTLQGLVLCGPHGEDEQRIAKLPAVGLQNVEWNPAANVNMVLLHFTKPAPGPYGSQFKGTYLVDLDRAATAQDPSEFIENLYDGTDVHTLWFSPKGTYATWSSMYAVYYRKPKDSPDKTVKLEHVGEDGDPLPIRGVYWSEDEKKLVYTAEGKVLLHDPERPQLKDTKVLASFPKGFVAEPRWVGSQIIVAHYEDVAEELAAKRGDAEACVAPPPGLRPANIKPVRGR